MSDELVSALQTFLRSVVIGLLMTTIVILGVAMSGINKDTGEISINWAVIKAIFFVEMIVVVRNAIPAAIDRYLHKSGIETPLNMKGLDQLRDSK